MPNRYDIFSIASCLANRIWWQSRCHTAGPETGWSRSLRRDLPDRQFALQFSGRSGTSQAGIEGSNPGQIAIPSHKIRLMGRLASQFRPSGGLLCPSEDLRAATAGETMLLKVT